MGRYTVAGPDGTGIEADGQFLAWAGSRTSGRVIVSELQALLDRAEAAEAKVAELLGQVPALPPVEVGQWRRDEDDAPEGMQ